MIADRGTLISLRNLRTSFGEVRAVDGVNLDIARGEVLGLVGESGSGKTTLGKTILHLVRPTDGTIMYEGRDIGQMTRSEIRKFRGNAQMVFQDPYSSLSPRLRVSYLLVEPYKINDIPIAKQFSVAELLEMVELSPELATKYPHELSGGQARRIGIARALALQPDFLVFDEPTSGLDVSAAAAVLNLMKDLSKRLGLTYLVISHTLSVVSYLADRVAVMYLGQFVELGPTDSVFDEAAHPYSRALLAAVSDPDPRRRNEAPALLLPGEIPSPKHPPPGCRFHTRCPYMEDRCQTEVPLLGEVERSHFAACHFWREVQADISGQRARRRAPQGQTLLT